LFFDIETSPNIGVFWNPGHNLTLTYDNIVEERRVICVAYKWEDSKQTHCITWDEHQCDKSLLEKFIPILHKSDEAVTHGGDRFDIIWLRTRCLFHGIEMSPHITSIDTLKESREKFRFNSNKLDYIARFLGLGEKIPTQFRLWKKVLLDNNRTALREMSRYCKQDVVLLEQIWNRLNPYLPPKTNRARLLNQCPECGSSNTHISKYRTTAAGYKKVQFQCQDCGKFHTIAASRYGEKEI
jgi:DNA polymerase elongation subunit (family B)